MELTPAETMEAYQQARKKARTSYFSRIARGHSGYIPALDGILENVQIVSEVGIGVYEIPIDKIRGTMSTSRSMMFAHNFLPLAKPYTEFFTKWCDLYSYHISEGIRDPIKVYEYMNWFYVMEGNKRVSVLKFVEAASISAGIIRLLPRKNSKDPSISRYYDFVEFNKITGIFTIWIRRRGGFKDLLNRLKKYDPPLSLYTNKYRHFIGQVYNPFRVIYFRCGGSNLHLTTGDAFLDFARIYGIPNELTAEKYEESIKGLVLEIKAREGKESPSVEVEPQKQKGAGIVSTISEIFVRPKVLKVAFVHSKNPETSGWTLAHDIAGKQVQKFLENKIAARSFMDVPEDENAYRVIRKISGEYDVVFTTSPTFLDTTYRAALEFPEVRFFNCNRRIMYKHVRTYFGRSYEVRHLLGLIAGTLTKTNRIGIIASFRTPENRTSVNSFALGVGSVNPHAAVSVCWTGEWDNSVRSKEFSRQLYKDGVDVISQNAMPPAGDLSKMHGLFGINGISDTGNFIIENYGECQWNWGVFYKRILQNVLSNTLKTPRENLEHNTELVNFWWGMDSGIVDIKYVRENLPPQVLNLSEGIKGMIIHNDYAIFQGIIHDQEKRVRLKQGDVLSYEEMLSQDWLAGNVIEYEGSV